MNRHYLPLQDLSSASAHGHQHTKKSSKPLLRQPLTESPYMVCTQAPKLVPLPDFTQRLENLEEQVATLQQKITDIDDLRYKVIQFEQILNRQHELPRQHELQRQYELQRQHELQTQPEQTQPHKTFREMDWRVLQDWSSDQLQDYYADLKHARENGYEILPPR